MNPAITQSCQPRVTYTWLFILPVDLLPQQSCPTRVTLYLTHESCNMILHMPTQTGPIYMIRMDIIWIKVGMVICRAILSYWGLFLLGFSVHLVVLDSRRRHSASLLFTPTVFQLCPDYDSFIHEPAVHCPLASLRSSGVVPARVHFYKMQKENKQRKNLHTSEHSFLGFLGSLKTPLLRFFSV